MIQTAAVFLSLCCFVLFQGCSPTRSLVANDGSNRLIGNSLDGNITVVLTTNAWEGDSEIERDFAVLHMLVHNRSPNPVLLAPGDFDLIDERGFRYMLQDSGGSFHRSDTNASTNSEADPKDDIVASGRKSYDEGRHHHFDQTVSTSADFARSALPWGVLLPGTQMRGYLYFEPIVRSANAATLYWHSQTPDHQALTTFGFRLRITQSTSKS